MLSLNSIKATETSKETHQKKRFKFSRIATFLPIVIISIAFLASVATGIIGYLNGQAGLQEATVAELNTLASSRADILSLKLSTVKSDLSTMATSSATQIVAEEINSAVVNMQAEIPEILEYFQTPETAKLRAELEGEGQITNYSFAHAGIHKSFSTSWLASGYGEIYILNEEGRVIYSVSKSGDFLGDITQGELADTDLASLFNQVKAAPEGQQITTELKSYKFADGKPAIFIGQPLWLSMFMGDPAFAGMIAIRLDVDFFNDIVSKTSGLGETGQVYLTDINGGVLSDMPRASELTSLKAKISYDVISAVASQQKTISGVDVTNMGVEVLITARPFDFFGKPWVVVAERSVDESLAAVKKMRDGMLLGGAVVLILAGIIALLLSRSITKPLSRLTLTMRALSSGEMEVKTQNNYWIDELRIMANSLLVFRDNAIARIKAETEKAKLDDEELRKAQHISGLIERFQTNSTENIHNVHQSSDRLEDVSKNLNISTSEMQDQSKLVTGNVEDTSENVVSAASATEEMVTSISEIARQAALSTEIAEEARRKTTETVTVINTLSSSAKHIEQVVKLIEEIAEQTNLLALNATIEAARAGDAGRGFAVVANEVKSLASQTAKATDEIASRVATIQADSSKANEAIVDVENIISKLSDSSLGVASSVEEQSAVINEIASNVTNASVLSTKSAESMQIVGNSIDDTKLVSNDVYGLANELNGQISSLENDISTFLADVKSA